ncbi:MAG: hypothetical protein IJX04_07195 [Oscillospiraceae bacterium]|nr:hypothetical protein [Oscillospiraceae bacterium]
MSKNKTDIQEVDAVLEAMEPAAVEAAAESKGFGVEARKKCRQSRIRERLADAAVHAVMVAAILAGVRWGLELPVLIGLGIYHTGASAVAWDRAKR